MREERQALTLLKVILAAGILSTAIHYTHNFIAVNRYPGPGGSFYTVVRIAIVVAWPLLTAIGLLGYRRYREQRYSEARVCRSSTAHRPRHDRPLRYGNPTYPAFFYATLFTDTLTGLAVLGFVLWAANVVEPRTESANA